MLVLSCSLTHSLDGLESNPVLGLGGSSGGVENLAHGSTGGSNLGGAGKAGAPAQAGECDREAACGPNAGSSNGSGSGGSGDAGSSNGSGGSSSSDGGSVSGGASGSSGEGGSGDEHSLTCPPEMALVRLEDEESTAFCIDRHEVTQAEYQTYLDAPSPGDTAKDCPGYVRTLPVGPEGEECLTPYRPADTPNHPVACVDLCDAIFYCRARDKRLCSGKLTGKLNAPARDEWFNACAGPNKHNFPYGDERLRDACNVGRGLASVVDVESFAECKSDWGVYDLSGNVAEWTRFCPDGEQCYVRGGSFASNTPAEVDCDTGPSDLMPKSTRSPYIGFRCCSSE